MKARDVLIAEGSPWRADAVVDTLLAQTPPGEPVVILADGTLARLEETWDDSVVGFERLYRLVNLTDEP